MNKFHAGNWSLKDERMLLLLPILFIPGRPSSHFLIFPHLPNLLSCATF
jgi:hypothetical protein